MSARTDDREGLTSDERPRIPALPRVIEVRPAPEPVEAFRKLADLAHVIFLDSAARDDVHGRYSYLTAHPFELIVSRGNRLRVLVPVSRDVTDGRYRARARAGGRTRRGADPLTVLEERLHAWNSAAIRGLPPFQGGAAGLFGYGLSRRIESVPPPIWDEFEAPDLAVGLYDWVLAFDQVAGTCHLVSHGFPEEEDRLREDRAGDRARRVLELLASRDAPRPAARAPGRRLPESALAPRWPLEPGGELLSNFPREGYVEAVSRGIEYIHAGDVFQVNLSQRLIHRETCSPLEFYLRLRERNPSSFAGFFHTGREVIASSSPEQFLCLSRGEVVTRPIKGTRSRGYTPEEDVYRRTDLYRSEKDRAENVMIVDLLRNDLSRVTTPGTVAVPRLFELERHPTVHHLVSEVRGHLRTGMGPIDLLRASFPGGSITGAPKIRAMEIIAELEPTARGAYCGSLGWISFDGDMGTSILIRTVTLRRGWFQLPAGGGIVADSRPETEYQETLDKAAGMLRALR